MKREILFRGKRRDTGEWIYGWLIQYENLKYYILWYDSLTFRYLKNEVIEETIGQFTGLTDKNGVNIFDGDKFNDDDNDGGYYLIEYNLELSKFCVNLYSYAMEFNEGGGEVFDNDLSLVDKNICDVFDMCDDIIIGNIHDNPEMEK